MIKLFSVLISIFLIIIISLRIPQESSGLSSFATKSDLLGSPGSAQKALNIVTVLAILVYISLAIQINFTAG